MARIVEAWGGPRDGEQFAVLDSKGRWDDFMGEGWYSMETVERRQHKLIHIRVMLRWRA